MDALLAALDKDPALMRRRVLTAAAMIVVLGLGAVGFVRGQAAKRRLCEGAQDEVHKAWSPEVRERVRLAFAKTNLTYADLGVVDAGAPARSVRRRLVKPIQRRVRSDARARRSVRGRAGSAHGLPQRSLEGALGAGVGDGASRQRHRAGGAARRAQPDAGRRVRRRRRAQSRDAATARRAAGQARRRARAAPRRDAGATRRRQERQAIKIGEPLLLDARAVGWQPLVADVELWIGRAGADNGDDTKSIPGFKNAFAAALAGRDDKVLRESAARLAQEYIYKNDMPDFDYWEQIARAALTRGTPDRTSRAGSSTRAASRSIASGAPRSGCAASSSTRRRSKSRSTSGS